MSTSHLNRLISIFVLLLVFLLLSASPTAEVNRKTSRNFSYRTQRFVPSVHHPYYVTPSGSCDTFSRTYARSMCLELQRIHRSSRTQPLPPPLEIDPMYGVDKRLVPSGPNPLHN
ncbi:CLAVATA3/ESR (CLE)-related protein 9 [Raphanus sativus]|uniref:CLAVATA3/ESR (CLE)-related protein 9 n=1 Tax=Raphanus sativus TaxID=3726 RepID=A0A6J0NRN3_RAPSA|nr:CLAVATA3/ESR (CLE)-related protein 9 [Raphanus sativus]KAJ4916596.1 CLAVATA3/ESR (CLE)-related protein 9 [Raphanus sativus]